MHEQQSQNNAKSTSMEYAPGTKLTLGDRRSQCRPFDHQGNTIVNEADVGVISIFDVINSSRQIRVVE